jgi:glycosyltransferase involved in cell wall biosynthesis
MSLVSVIIPTYYRNDDLEKAIESALNQTYPDIEIIVVDDSGEKHAKRVCDEFDVTYIGKRENEGPMAAWNTGFERADGRYIQILDDDDQLFSEKIEKQVKLLRNNDEIGVAHCGMRWDFGVEELPDSDMSGDVLPTVLTLDTSPCVTSTILIDCTVLRQFCPISEYDGAADDVLKIELAQRTQFDYVDEVLVLRGTGEDNVSTSMAPIQASERILDDYSQLYKQVRSNIRGRARSKILYRKGYALLAEDIWSSQAISCFAKSIRLCPTRDLRAIPVLIAAFGGRPGISTLEKIGVYARLMISINKI